MCDIKEVPIVSKNSKIKVMLTGKHSALYEQMFEELFRIHKDQLEKINEIVFISDDEVGVYTAFERVAVMNGKKFTNRLCYFHHITGVQKRLTADGMTHVFRRFSKLSIS